MRKKYTHLRVQKSTHELLTEVKQLNERMTVRKITYDALLRDMIEYANDKSGQ
jgi:hypothetical protein